MLNCQKCLDFILAYLEGDLPTEQHEEFEKHMQMCPPCKDYLDTYMETVRLTQCCGQDTEDLPPMPDSLVIAIVAACKGCCDESNEDKKA